MWEECNMGEGCPPGWWMIESGHSCGMSMGFGGKSSILGGGVIVAGIAIIALITESFKDSLLIYLPSPITGSLCILSSAQYHPFLRLFPP